MTGRSNPIPNVGTMARNAAERDLASPRPFFRGAGSLQYLVVTRWRMPSSDLEINLISGARRMQGSGGQGAGGRRTGRRTSVRLGSCTRLKSIFLVAERFRGQKCYA
jgi:hypothetical protein